MEKEPITSQGLEKLKKELEELEDIEDIDIRYGN